MLCSCSTITTPTQGPTTSSKLSWQERQALLNKLQTWQVNGKIAVHTPQDSGSATVDWSQNHGRYTVSLFGPLGAGSMKLSGKPGKVTLDMSDGKHVSAKSPEDLLAKAWGFKLPVSYLNFWIRGLPVPGVSANTQFDDSHHLVQLTQAGWRVQFLNYTHINQLDLPTKLEINSPSLTSKIIIYDWNINK